MWSAYATHLKDKRMKKKLNVIRNKKINKKQQMNEEYNEDKKQQITLKFLKKIIIIEKRTWTTRHWCAVKVR